MMMMLVDCCTGSSAAAAPASTAAAPVATVSTKSTKTSKRSRRSFGSGSGIEEEEGERNTAPWLTLPLLGIPEAPLVTRSKRPKTEDVPPLSRTPPLPEVSPTTNAAAAAAAGEYDEYEDNVTMATDPLCRSDHPRRPSSSETDAPSQPRTPPTPPLLVVVGGGTLAHQLALRNRQRDDLDRARHQLHYRDDHSHSHHHSHREDATAMQLD